MKNSILYITTIFLFLITITQIQAQKTSTKNNYVVLTKNSKQLEPILLTANELAKEDGFKYGDFHVIICGKTVSDIPNNYAFNKLLITAKKQHVKVFVCGISLDKLKIKKSELPENITITKNGILYGFQLIKKGFISLTI
ncbi:DsrE family protein [Tenacibaculum piscium]|uniref:DsrE family protein n=1 Tax=Tenacibaculum piscium TaxID=1458515 RepID=UPI001F3A43B7|nr:sulfur reduction protein DsrE [Tenacibaculum piscium]